MRVMGVLAGAAMVVWAMAGPAAAVPVTAPLTIDSGKLVGSSENGVAAYLGVPYAAPPIGPLRWKPPQPVQPWSGERTAGQYGPNCAQVVRGGAMNGGGVSTKGEEDCLTLQVFAPTGAKKAPVMVWLHGGANMTGSSSLAGYNGSAFAKDGVVLVAVNYRLGPFGFFAHPALSKAAPKGELLANYGLMDQIAALKWVQRNVAAFGGDPANVTVFGESAGGEDTLALLSMPSTTGLFAKAIVESGLGWEEDPTLAQAEKQGAEVAVKAGAPADATPDQLRALPVDALLEATPRAGRVIDGRLLPETPAQAFASGRAHDVPLIIGSNSWEGSLIARFMDLPLGPKGYMARQPDGVKPAYTGLDDKAAAYAMFNDGVMGAPARWIAGKASTGAPSWLYYFSFVPAAQRASVPGTSHAGEIRYVFGSWAGTHSATPDEETLALTKVVHACWVSFAKNGRPEKCAPGGWPEYDPVKDQLMEFGVSTGLRTNFRKPQLDAWEAAKPEVVSGK